jgi:hypothetical protein
MMDCTSDFTDKLKILKSILMKCLCEKEKNIQEINQSRYYSFCIKCEKITCGICEKEHLNHEKEKLDQIIQNIDEVNKRKNELETGKLEELELSIFQINQYISELKMTKKSLEDKFNNNNLIEEDFYIFKTKLLEIVGIENNEDLRYLKFSKLITIVKTLFSRLNINLQISENQNNNFQNFSRHSHRNENFLENLNISHFSLTPNNKLNQTSVLKHKDGEKSIEQGNGPSSNNNKSKPSISTIHSKNVNLISNSMPVEGLIDGNLSQTKINNNTQNQLEESKIERINDNTMSLTTYSFIENDIEKYKMKISDLERENSELKKLINTKFLNNDIENIESLSILSSKTDTLKSQECRKSPSTFQSLTNKNEILSNTNFSDSLIHILSVCDDKIIYYCKDINMIKKKHIDYSFPDSISFVNHNNSLHITGGKGKNEKKYLILKLIQKENSSDENCLDYELVDYGEMNVNRYNHCSFMHKDILYVVGGDNCSEVERFDRHENTWSNLPKMNHKRSRCCSMIVNTNGSQYLYVFLGYENISNDKKFFFNIERLDLSKFNQSNNGNCVWEVKSINDKYEKYFTKHSSSLLKVTNPNSTVLILGGNELRNIPELNFSDISIVSENKKMPSSNCSFINIDFFYMDGNLINIDIKNNCYLYEDEKIKDLIKEKSRK